MNILLRRLAPALAALSIALPVAAEPLPLSEISAYLNSIRSAEAKFTQINDDGSISTGTLYIKRPGRMRFEYAPPNDALVLASAGAVAIHDPKSDAGPETYPLSRTPLKIILDDNVDLTRARMVTGHREDGPSTIVTAQDPEHPEYGNIELVFTGNPVELRQWVVNDDAGGATTMVLGDLRTGLNLKDSYFNIQLNTERERMR
ncbi:LolA family protein [Pseudooceanicola aestuarii]|uniref:LolA family protein n=1 Tax=Pseudooceanicola aestuarii TaxID=2697319 RepID=UPI0013D1431F|nr:outer membrane lipoprotein carrier protein LolA [Pseudooceanicola aestuarii]